MTQPTSDAILARLKGRTSCRDCGFLYLELIPELGHLMHCAKNNNPKLPVAKPIAFFNVSNYDLCPSTNTGLCSQYKSRKPSIPIGNVVHFDLFGDPKNIEIGDNPYFYRSAIKEHYEAYKRRNRSQAERDNQLP